LAFLGAGGARSDAWAWPSTRFSKAAPGVPNGTLVFFGRPRFRTTEKNSVIGRNPSSRASSSVFGVALIEWRHDSKSLFQFLPQKGGVRTVTLGAVQHRTAMGFDRSDSRTKSTRNKSSWGAFFDLDLNRRP